MVRENNSFLNKINNNLLLTLTFSYIIIILLFFYFNKFSWMSYKADLDSSVECQLDDIEDEARSTRTRLGQLLIKNKILFYIIFVITGLISLIIAWGLKISEKRLPQHFFFKVLSIFLMTAITIGIFVGTFYFFSYTPIILTIFINIINLLVVASVLALFYEKFPKKYSSLGIGIFSFLAFTLLNGLTSGMIFGFIGALFGYVIGQKETNQQKKSSPIWNFIRAVLVSLPCLIIQFAGLLGGVAQNELNNSNNKIWIYIIAIILVLISLKIIIPIIYNQLIKQTLPEGNILIKNPVSLNNSNNLGNFESYMQTIDNKIHEHVFLNYNYALSCWLWIFPESPSTSLAYNKPTSILNISNIINILFNNNNIEFWAGTTTNTTSEKLVKIFVIKDFKFQKWNNLIINYYGGTLDIFINRKLVSSTPNIIPLDNRQPATVGEQNGIYGGIKDIVYYKNTLTEQQIDIINNF